MKELVEILVVDDDEVDRMAVRRALRAAETEIVFYEASDYPSTIALLEARDFDCIFLDYRLPGKDGLALVQDLRQAGVKIPLIVLTGQGDEQIAVDLMKAGATDYLPKSKVSPEILLPMLRSALRLYWVQMEAEIAKQQREQLARQREDFVYRLTHDLRTPLVAADRMFALFQQRAFGELSADMETAIVNMVRNNRNLLQMVNTMLEVFRHDAGHKTLNFVSCNLQHIIQEVVQELTPLADEKGLTLTVDYGDRASHGRLMIVQGDALELRRVLTNLVSNAIKFTEQGSITVRLKSARGKQPNSTAPANAIVEVEDTGVGIAPDDQKLLFERFRQSVDKRSASGLGLYLSRCIVEGHKGTIAVESEPGKGSVFRLRLPIQP